MASEALVGLPITLNIPMAANYLTIVHEYYSLVGQSWLAYNGSNTAWPGINNVDVNSVAVTPSGTYVWTPNSIGSYRLYYTATPNVFVPSFTVQTIIPVVPNDPPSVVVFSDYYSIYSPYAAKADFIADYPAYSAITNGVFAKNERRIRRVIENFCQQQFGPYIIKTQVLQGRNDNILTLNNQCFYLRSVIDTFGNDMTALVNLDSSSPFFISRQGIAFGYYDSSSHGLVDVKLDIARDSRNVFRDTVDYYVTGDFGWLTVPDDVLEATKILIADELSGANDAKNHGLKEAQLGDYSYKLGFPSLEGTTGNLQADMLLSPYINTLQMRLI